MPCDTVIDRLAEPGCCNVIAEPDIVHSYNTTTHMVAACKSVAQSKSTSDVTIFDHPRQKVQGSADHPSSTESLPKFALIDTQHRYHGLRRRTSHM